MPSWVLVAGFALAYFGGSMSMIVYHDAREQGKSKRVASLYSLGVAFTASTVYSLITIFVR